MPNNSISRPVVSTTSDDEREAFAFADEAEILRPNAVEDAVARLRRQVLVVPDRDAAFKRDGAVRPQRAGQHVHRRRADEARDEGVGRPVVDMLRRAGLLDIAVAHDDDAIGERHRLYLIVGDVDHGGLQPLVQLANLRPHLHAELGVEVGERLVEEEDDGLPHQSAAHGDTLALPPGWRRKLTRDRRLR